MDSARLIVTDPNRVDIGEVPYISFDLAFGTDENAFKLVAYASDFTTDKGGLVYIDGTEYGGIIDSKEITLDNSGARIVTYSGRTWQGILANLFIVPDSGKPYYSVANEANRAIGEVLERLGLSNIMTASSDVTGMVITGYTFGRFVNAYSGLRKMLASAGGLLVTEYDHVSKRVIVSARRRVDIPEQSIDDAAILLRSTRSVNHIIVGGAGQLDQRVVIHRYVDANGNITTEPTFTGADEIAYFYDYTTANQAEAEEMAESWLRDAQQIDAFEVRVTGEDMEFRIGDVIPVSDPETGTIARGEVAKKIVRVDAQGNTSISYETANETGAARYGDGALWPFVYYNAEDNRLYYVTGAIEQEVGLPFVFYTKANELVYYDGGEGKTEGDYYVYRGYDGALYANEPIRIVI